MALRIRAERMSCSKQGPPRLGLRRAQSNRGPTVGFTLIEMLVAMAITLVMMGAVVTLFANISNSVRNRRATTEMSGQLRHVRNVLQQDLQGATCPGVTWQRPESNHGYIEIIEGQYREGYATNLIDADPVTPNSPTWPPTPINPEIDHKTSTLPSSNPTLFKDPTWATDGGGLGDADDILMLTVRNEHEPFNGRSPTNVRPLNSPTSAAPFSVSRSDAWGYESIQSPLAEVVWFAVENPGYTEDPPVTDPSANHFFGEPGFRTIYRRALLIAPWLNPYRFVDPKTGVVSDTFKYDGGTLKAQPGLMRILPTKIAADDAIAAVVAFQDQYDLSVRLEWDGDIQRWKIVANTLGDLTKRENRFGHFFYRPVKSGAKPVGREYPFALISTGSGYSGGSANAQFVTDPEAGPAPATPATAKANLNAGAVASYSVTTPGTGYAVRPFVFVNADSTTVATAQAMLNEDGSIVRVVHGPVPLWGSRRGQDVMMTDVLAFDLRVYDPGAPMFATVKVPGLALSDPKQSLDIVLTPSDPGWLDAYMSSDNMQPNGKGAIGQANSLSTVTYPYVGQGAYVDLGYGYNSRWNPPGLPYPKYASSFASSADPWFLCSTLNSQCARLYINSTGNPAFVVDAGALRDVYGNPLAPGFAVYDTWSFHYENDGIDEDGNGIIDQGTNGLDDVGNYPAASPTPATVKDTRLGVDDVGERETTPPYDKPLRGMQVLIRTYEHDSRAIRQVRVNQHFMAE